MTIVERGSVIIIEGTNISAGFQQAVTDETGCRIICLDPEAGERVVAVIPPEREYPKNHCFADPCCGNENNCTSETRTDKDSEKIERVIRSMGGDPDAAVGVALGVEPVTDIDDSYEPSVREKLEEYRQAGDKIVELLDGVVKVKSRGFANGGRTVTVKGTLLKQLAPFTTPALREILKSVINVHHVDFLPSFMVIKGSLVSQDSEKLPVVPDDVRKRAERAADMIGVTKYSDMRVHVVHAAIYALMNDDTLYLIGDETRKKVLMPTGIVNLSNLQGFLDAVERALQPKPAVEPDPVELHRAALEAHTEAEKYSDAISALPADFKSEGREMMLNEYFERQRKAINATRATNLRHREVPDGEKIETWAERSNWHYHVKGRHAQILRILTDQ